MRTRFRAAYPTVLPLLLLMLAGYFYIPGFNRLGMYLNIFQQSSIIGIQILGMLFVLICGDIDLSVGAQTSFYGVLCVYLSRMMPLLPAVAFTLLTAVGWGFVTSTLIIRRQLHPMVATIAGGVLLTGISYCMARGLPLFDIPPALERLASYSLGGLSFPALLFPLTAVLCSAFLHNTFYGKYFYAVGTSVTDAQLAGVPIARTRTLAFVLCSMLNAVAAIVYVGRISMVSLTMGSNEVLDVFTAAALAGVGFRGGRGSVLPVVCATVLMSALSAAFLALRLPSYYENVLNGMILFAAISTNFAKS